MLRRTFIFLIALLAHVLPIQLLQASSPPNVLLIITDDQGYGDFSLHGNTYLHTPHIDRLGKESVRFDRFFVNSFCAPTRAALLTGRWPLRCGVHGVTHNKEAMKPEEVTLAEAFGANGYRTACIGKWHNGEQFPYTPKGQGFDEVFGFNNGHWNNYFNATLLRDTTPVQTEGYITDILTNDAIRFITASKEKPFFCYLAYNAPHSPFQVPDSYYDKFRAQGLAEDVAAFWGMCENIDDNIGRLLTHLDNEHLSENTIVIFLTDNGGTAGVKLYNAGMRGGKTSVHEGGTRVPLFMRWPAAGWSPHLVEPITSHIDIYPTLMDLCSLTPPAGPPIDGRSLRPLLEGNSTDWPERVLFTHNPINESNKFPGAVRTQQYRLVCKIKGPSGGSSAKENDRSATPWELYDMTTDPGEKQNLARKHPELVQQLSRLYDQWYADISSQGVKRPPIPIGYDQHNPVELHAPQAYFDEPLQFASGPGYANDWLTSWSDSAAKVWFDIEVITPGWYEAELAYSTPADQPTGTIELTTGSSSTQADIPAAPAQPIDLPHRDERGKERYRNRQWATLPLGRIELKNSDHTLTLKALHLEGDQLLDLKHLRLKKIK